MANGTWSTTAQEDAAILALSSGKEDVPSFINRIIRHQVDFAVELSRESVQTAYDKLPPAEKSKVDAILNANKK